MTLADVIVGCCVIAVWNLACSMADLVSPRNQKKWLCGYAVMTDQHLSIAVALSCMIRVPSGSHAAVALQDVMPRVPLLYEYISCSKGFPSPKLS